MIANLPEYLRDFVLFGYLTGMRRGEIASLEWADVDGDIITLRGENAKTGESRTVPLNRGICSARQFATSSGRAVQHTSLCPSRGTRPIRCSVGMTSLILVTSARPCRDGQNISKLFMRRAVFK